MTLTLGQIANFPNLYQEISGFKLPIQVVYKLSRLRKEIEFHISFYKENVQKILSECAELDEQGLPRQLENGNGVMLKPDCIEKCIKQIEELGALAIDIPDIYFSILDFDGVEISMQSFEIIAPFIKE